MLPSSFLHSQALDLTPNEKNCLVSRSKCYLQLGDMQSALMDAEASLEEEKDFHKVSCFCLWIETFIEKADCKKKINLHIYKVYA